MKRISTTYGHRESKLRPDRTPLQAIDGFIAQAREKQLSDDDILALATQAGWQRATVLAKLHGLVAPEAPQSESATPTQASIPTKSETAKSIRPSLSPLIATMHHVFLWFFVGVSSFTIGYIVSYLFAGSEYTAVAAKLLATFIAIVIVAFGVYLAFYVPYLRHTLKPPYITADNKLSIMTICLNGIGAMASAIATIAFAINSDEIQYTIGSALIFILFLAVTLIYLAATFIPPQKKLRAVLLVGGIVVITLMIMTLFALSLLRLPGEKHDGTLRENLSKTVENIKTYTNDHKKLPSADDSSVVAGADITYTPSNNISYQVCGKFKRHTSDSDSYNALDNRDDNVTSYSFPVKRAGKNCFTFTSSNLEDYNQSKQTSVEDLLKNFNATGQSNNDNSNSKSGVKTSVLQFN